MESKQESQAPYERIAAHFRGQIEAGQLVQGDRLPSVREIAEEWRVAKATADRAMTLLKTEGLVRTGKGSTGTIVDVQTGREMSVVIAGTTETIQVKSTRVVVPSDGTAKELGITPGTAIVVVRLFDPGDTPSPHQAVTT